MAKLIKYDHFERHSGYIITDFIKSQIFYHYNLILAYRYLGASPSDGDLAYTMTSAALISVEKSVSLKLSLEQSQNDTQCIQFVL